MELRLIEVALPHGQAVDLEAVVGELPVVEVWQASGGEGAGWGRILVRPRDAEAVLDALDERLGPLPGFRALLTPVEAALPPVGEEGPEGAPAEAGPSPGEGSEEVPDRISRHEIHADVSPGAEASRVYRLLVLLSSIVAAVGIVRGNPAVIIGAMVIAPLLGPNVALTLATTIGDGELARRAMRTGAVGVAIALGFSVAVGLILHVDPALPEVASRTRVGEADVALALAAGAAGALSVTAGAPGALIGVMVAVALLPPLVTLGLLLGSGSWRLAGGAALLFLTNLICINLAGVVTFWAQGVRPGRWWEARRARQATRRALALWMALLAALVFFLLLARFH
ncbi:MAG: TIGR00341 family protein [Deferrisomatales bacterium]